ncbi:hypothetical protein Pla175_17500 [Pirellulimonas nuda]|uniref:Uncharacterized protein n=1 Tax=Pirellulimonas nuda TaxID=2528009 RepID=A0A518DA62_9BACT|nr:hypothetical protein [Pirellulimonas nuda]QDU88374.1 hypothetical protein Pla175_17500 [Pirellulimonas nuda]
MSDYYSPASETLPLFEAPPPPRSANSAAAAKAIVPRARSIRGSILAHVRDCGAAGATDQEICAALGIDGSTVRPARLALVRRGLLIDTGRDRLTKAQNLARIHVAASEAASQPSCAAGSPSAGAHPPELSPSTTAP